MGGLSECTVFVAAPCGGREPLDGACCSSLVVSHDCVFFLKNGVRKLKHLVEGSSFSGARFRADRRP